MRAHVCTYLLSVLSFTRNVYEYTILCIYVYPRMRVRVFYAALVVNTIYKRVLLRENFPLNPPLSPFLASRFTMYNTVITLHVYI